MKKQKKNINMLLAFCVLLALSGMGCELPNTSVAPGSIGAGEQREVPSTDDFLASASEHKFEGVSINDIRRFLNEGRQIYQDLRVQSDTEGTMTYRVPVQDSEIEYLMNIQDRAAEGDVQLLNSAANAYSINANSFPVTQIRNSGRSDADSIVIILMGDGFTAAQYGTWPNPAPGTVLRHADNAIYAMHNTQPYNLFSHLFTVYVIHNTDNLGTIRNDAKALGGTTTTDTSRTTQSIRIREL